MISGEKFLGMLKDALNIGIQDQLQNAIYSCNEKYSNILVELKVKRI
jgi:hypothetical protein